MIDSRNVDELHPLLQILAKELIKRMSVKGHPVLITSTYRDFEKQNALYAQGRTTQGAIITNAKGGSSAHNYRLAFDICKNIKGEEYSDLVFYNTAGQIGRELGLEWGGDFNSIKDKPHFQLMLGYSCSSYLSGTKVPETVKMGCADKRIVSFVQKLLGITADGLFGQKTKEAVLKYNSTGEVDAATLKRLIDGTFESKVKVSIDGKISEIPAELLNNSWVASLVELNKLMPDNKVAIRAVLEAARYRVGWENNVIIAVK